MKMISFPVPARDNVRDAEGRLVAELRVPLIDGQLNWDEKQSDPGGGFAPRHYSRLTPEPRPKQHGAGVPH